MSFVPTNEKISSKSIMLSCVFLSFKHILYTHTHTHSYIQICKHRNICSYVRHFIIYLASFLEPVCFADKWTNATNSHWTHQRTSQPSKSNPCCQPSCTEHICWTDNVKLSTKRMLFCVIISVTSSTPLSSPRKRQLHSELRAEAGKF